MLTPKQRHRAGVFARHGCTCYAADDACLGRIEAAHWVGVQTLRRWQSQERVANRWDFRHRPLLDVTEDELVADDRNGVPLCAYHHACFDRRNGQALDLEPPDAVLAFVAQYRPAYLTRGS